MPSKSKSRIVRAVHGKRKLVRDAAFELGLAEHLRSRYDGRHLVELYGRFAVGEGEVELLMRRAIWRAAARRFGHGVHVGSGAGFKHLETFEIGDGVFFGAQSYVQG